ncbi:MAG: beta-L-arabinofuranosidase domain-containing protein [Candidatus Latescibacterota bacterium]
MPAFLSRILGMLRIAASAGHWRVVLRDLLHRGEPLHEDEAHLRAAMDWLARAQDVAGCGGGLSAGYSFRRGWLPPYPETTGYIIPTFLRYGEHTGDDGWIQRAVRAGDWESEIQLAAGGVRGGQGINTEPVVFNTGQVILGWCALHRTTGHDKYLESATRAADWLLQVQDRDGAWRQNTYEDTPHTYHSRVAWPLLEVAAATGEARYRSAAAANLDWVIAQARSNGWVESMSFRRGDDPYTHTIAYTYRGLLECGLQLQGDTGVSAMQLAQLGADRLLRRYELNKPDPHAEPWPLPATLNSRWQPSDEGSSCVPGNAQIALLWLRLAVITAQDQAASLRWTNSALKLLDQVKATQSLRSRHDGIRGGVPGSSPVWSWYLRLTYPNWAAKFLADALMETEAAL